MTIELWPIDRPIPYARNARKLSASAVDQIAASLKEFGWQQPIVVDGAGVIVVGHTRLMAAKKLGMTEVPVQVALDLSPAQIKAYRLMDNRSHQETSWDFELLPGEFLELKELDFDLGLTGFAVDEIGKLLDAGEGAASEDGEGQAGGEPAADNAPVISYSIVFNTEDEQQAWFTFLKALKGIYPEATIAERIIWYVEKHGPQE